MRLEEKNTAKLLRKRVTILLLLKWKMLSGLHYHVENHPSGLVA